MQNILHKLVALLQLVFVSTLLLSALALAVTGNLFFAYVLIAHAVIVITVGVVYILSLLFAALYTFYNDAIHVLLNK